MSDVNNEKLVLDVKELQMNLGIGREIAYKLMRSRAFPSTKIGGRYIVSKDALKRWLQSNEGKNFIL